MQMETIIQSVIRIENIIYSLPYDSLSSYLQGVRDMINLINGEEDNIEIANTICKLMEKASENTENSEQ